MHQDLRRKSDYIHKKQEGREELSCMRQTLTTNYLGTTRDFDCNWFRGLKERAEFHLMVCPWSA